MIIPVIDRNPMSHKFPCPCGLDAHARFSSTKIHFLCRQTPHSTDPNAHPDSDNESHPEKDAYSLEKGAYSHLSDHGKPDTTTGSYDVQVDDPPVPPEHSSTPLESRQSSSLMDLDPPSPAQPSDDYEMLDSEPTFDGEQVLDGLLEQCVDTLHVPHLAHDPDDHQHACRYLQQRGILVDDCFNLTICIDCNACISYDNIYGHRRSCHCNSTIDYAFLGPRDLLVNHLKKLQAHRPHSLPSFLSKPLPVLPVITAYRCGAPNCTESKIFPSLAKVSRHCFQSHPDIPPRRRPHITVYAQRIGQFRGGVYYIEVAPPSLQDVHPKVEDVLSHSRELGVGLKNEMYRSTDNIRGKNEFLMRTRWDSILHDVKLSRLRLAVGLPNPSAEPTFVRLVEIVRKYYHDIADRLDFTLSTLVLRYLHSQDPEYVDLKYVSFSY
jgi:hypothetical protein